MPSGKVIWRLGHITIAILVVLFLAALLYGFHWRTDQKPLRVVAVTPNSEASDVSTRTTSRVTLNRVLRPDEAWPALVIEPQIQGDLRIQDSELVFEPLQALAPQTTYTLHIPALGATWSFTTGPLRVLYLAPDAGMMWQIHTMPLDGDEVSQLTHASEGVRDYAVSPDGSTIVYAAHREDGGQDLWLVARDGSAERLLVPCPGAACREASWWPDSSKLVYERHSLQTGAAPADAVSLWMVSLTDGDTTPLNDSTPIAATHPRISPDGQWLAAICAATEQLMLYELATMEGAVVALQSGMPVAWHPQQNAFLASQATLQEEKELFGLSLLLGNLETGVLRMLDRSEGETNLQSFLGEPQEEILLEDAYGAWSPDGSWIAFGRRSVSHSKSLARQLWLIDSQGEAARPLTDDSQIQHGAPHWSPDGTLVLYSRHVWNQFDGPQALGITDITTGSQRLLPVKGNWPAWLP